MILNPEYQLYYFDDDDVGEFMQAYSERAYIAYKKLKPGAFKADLFRYCVLEKFGGCYSDIGHMMHVSFDRICENNKLVLVKDRLFNKHDNRNKFDTGIHNALMCTVPHHPYIIKLVEECINNVESSYYGYDALCITGPIFAGTVFYKLYDMNYELREMYHFQNETEKVNTEMFIRHIKVGTRNNIKILQLDDTAETIIDNTNKIILQRKFKDYYKIMYHDHNRARYYEDWRNKNVYN
jgi:mannosyltransferase OCH1-like enzyme